MSPFSKWKLLKIFGPVGTVISKPPLVQHVSRKVNFEEVKEFLIKLKVLKVKKSNFWIYSRKNGIICEVIEEGEDLAVYDRLSRFSRDPNYYSATKIRCSVVL